MIKISTSMFVMTWILPERSMYLQPHYGNGVFGNIYLSAGGKHCWHPIAVMGVVDTFGHYQLPQIWKPNNIFIEGKY